VQRLFQLQGVSQDYLNTQYKILRSGRLAGEVIGELHLDRTREFNPPPGGWPWRVKAQGDRGAAGGLATTAAEKQHVLAEFEQRLQVEPVNSSLLVRVKFESQNPARAARVVNALTETYIQDNLRTHWDATQQASAWLSKQLEGLKLKLETSEDALQRYAETNGLLYLENGNGQAEDIVNQRLEQIQNELTVAQADLYRKESLARLAAKGEAGALPGVFENKTIASLNAKLADLERQQARLAPNFKPGYPEMREIESQIDRLRGVVAQQRALAARHIQDEYLAAAERAALLRRAFDQQKRQANVVAEKSVAYNILRREVDTNKQLYRALLERLKEAGVSAGLKASNISVVDAAVPPTRPVSPRVLLNLAVGLVLGLCGGVCAAFVQEHLDNTLKSQADIEAFLGVPALALIPSCRSLESAKEGFRLWMRRARLAPGQKPAFGLAPRATRNGWLRVDSESLEHSALSEAFRSLRTSVLLSAAARPPRSLAVISSEPAEGKTTICANLAISLAQLGKRVLAVDADLRQPCLDAFFHLPESAGLVNYLAGEQGWRELARPSGTANLDCLVCGPLPPNPSELLSSDRMRAFMREAAAQYDFVIVDSPPLLNLADGRILGTMVEGAILVAKGGATPRERVQRAHARLADVGARVIGAVLNDVALEREADYAPYYDYPPRHRQAASSGR
jgi:capsular exopolysaccharide synthesis family protein